MWKDDRMLRAVMEQLSGTAAAPLFVAVGRDSVAPVPHGVELHAVPYQRDPLVMARYYQAADIYLHAARADTFPLAVLEALACGTPVVATDVGGISEQVRPVDVQAIASGWERAADGATGALVPRGDARRMAEAAALLLASDRVRDEVGAQASRDARQRFGLDRQADNYLAWYHVALNDGSGNGHGSGNGPATAHITSA